MTAWTRAFVLRARAKLNLALSVGGIRPNRLHEVRSLAASLALADEVFFDPNEGGDFTVECDGVDVLEHDNLAFRAAAALEIDGRGIRIRIKKHIPVEAGLGGGSADGAAALQGLARIARERGSSERSDAELFRAATVLGSDVPACLIDGFKWIGGSGEIVREEILDAPPWGVALLKPAASMPTAVAYRLFDEAVPALLHAAEPVDDRDRSAVVVACIRSCAFQEFCDTVHNDFDTIVQRAIPDVARAHDRLRAVGADATVLCGSGTAVAGFFPSTADAEAGVSRVEVAPGEWAAAAGFAVGR